ncbi:recombinase family protein [Clostridium tyrobutyricum]|uniref:recombinase family protein n=1 Tax=Clostridium tyrobutyricum TaxID=1519 RepID=UPI0010AA3F18|nr:recombinase family protein [Clostridium tyrobutyricum]QCH29398.1 Tn552 family DNA-invertase bin3 [Clostridium tyrobutyricum]
MPKTMGYCRVSSMDQNETRQILKMKSHGIDDRYIFIDKKSGKDFNRLEYQLMKRFCEEGDLIYIDSLDRLGRNYDDIINEWKYITRKINANIVCLDNETLFDSRKFKSMGDIGKLMEDQFLSLLSYVAEQERKKIKQRQAEGIIIAKSRGKYKGRKKIEINSKFQKIYTTWKDGEITATNAMELLGLKRNTFYRRVKEYEANLRSQLKQRED